MVYTISGRKTDNVESGNGCASCSVWKEIAISFLASLPFFTHGIETIFLTSSAHSGHFFAYDDVPWSSTAFVLMTALTAPVYCYLIDKIGRKSGIFIISLVQGASLIPLFYLNDTNTIFLHILAGAASGGLFTVLPTYIREICSVKTRGLTLSLMMMMTAIGYMMNLAMTLETMMYIMVALVTVQLFTMLLMLESPSYLVKASKNESALRNIAKIKGLPGDGRNVTKEFSNLKSESEKAKGNGKITAFTIYRNKIWWDSFKMGIILHTTMVLCGSILFLNQDWAFMQLKLMNDPDKTLVLSSLTASSIFAVICLTFLDRKIMLILGYTLMILASGVLAVYTQVDLNVTSTRWLPIASLVILVFGYGVSWALPTVVAVELFNLEIRATLLGALCLYSQLLKLVHIHTLDYVVNWIGVHALLYIFSGINMLGLVYTLFSVPRIRHKSLTQIEKQMKRTPLPA